MGAWIERRRSGMDPNTWVVAPYVGVWITLCKWYGLKDAIDQLARGCTK